MISASGAWAAQTCTPEAAIVTSSPFYNVENSDSPGGSTCLTVSPSGVSFRVDSSSYDTSDGVPADQQFTGYMAVFTGCKHGGCFEPNYPALASRIAIRGDQLVVQFLGHRPLRRRLRRLLQHDSDRAERARPEPS